MFNRFALMASVSLSLGLTITLPQQASAAPAACSITGAQKALAVSGVVVQVGKEPGLFQHMIVQDDKTNCKVVVLVETNDKPCAYLSRAAITMPTAPATPAEKKAFGMIDLMDKGENEMFACK